MVHFHAICVGCALDSIYCLQIFRPEIPVHVTKWCQMNSFQNLENKSGWILFFFCFPAKAQELVNLPNTYLTLASHSKLLFLISQVRKQVFHWIHHISSACPKAVALTASSHTCSLATVFFFLHLLHFQSTVSLNGITLALKVGKKFWLEQVNVHFSRKPRQKYIWVVPECQWNEHRWRATYSMGSTFLHWIQERYTSAVGNHWQRHQSEPWLNSYQPSDLFLSAVVQDPNTSDEKQAVCVRAVGG